MTNDPSIDKEAVREAYSSAKDRGAKTSVAAIYHDELPRLFQKKGNMPHVSRWLKEIKAEERATAAGELTMAPAEPLPEAVAAVFDNGVAVLTGSFKSMAGSLSVALADIRTGMSREKDLAIATIRADADRRITDADEETRDAMLVAERYESERDAVLQQADNLTAELATAREALAASNARGEELAKALAAAKDEVKAERGRADQEVRAAGDAKAEAARLAAELKAAGDDKDEATSLTAETKTTGRKEGKHA